MYLQNFGRIDDYYKSRGTVELKYTTKSGNYKIYETHLQRANDFFFDGLCVEDVQSKYVIYREIFNENKGFKQKYYDALAFCLYFLNKKELDTEDVIEEINGYEIKLKTLPKEARRGNNNIFDICVYIKGTETIVYKGVNNYSQIDEYFYNDVERKVLDCKNFIEKIINKSSTLESSNYTRVRNDN